MGKKATVAFTLRIDAELHRLLCAAAGRVRKDNTEWLRDLLQRELDKNSVLVIDGQHKS